MAPEEGRYFGALRRKGVWVATTYPSAPPDKIDGLRTASPRNVVPNTPPPTLRVAGRLADKQRLVSLNMDSAVPAFVIPHFSPVTSIHVRQSAETLRENP